MIEITKSTVFNTGAKTIVNTVNTVGVMGAGLALEFALRYPAMEKEYIAKCKSKEITVGKVDYYSDSDISIVNFPTKAHFKYPSQMRWIVNGLEDFVRTYKLHGIESVAFPKLGCSNGNLDWGEVKPIMIKYLDPLDIKVYICEDSLHCAEGIEKKMVDAFNSLDADGIAEFVKLTSKQKEAIELAKPVERFWQIGKIAGIGSTTYKAIFNHFYRKNDYEQLSLF